MSALGLIAKLTTALLITQAEVPAPTAPTPASEQEADTAVEAAPEPAAPPGPASCRNGN